MTCKHGRLARSCVVCGLERDLVECAHGWALAEEALRNTVSLADNLNRYAAAGAGFRLHWGERVEQATREARAYLAGREGR